MSDYATAKPILASERLLYCTRCGALIADCGVTAHDRFHNSLVTNMPAEQEPS